MIIYYLIILYIVAIGQLGKQRLETQGIVSKYNNKTSLLYALLIMALPVFFIGLRTNVADTPSYISGFERLSLNFPDLSSGIFGKRGLGWSIYEWAIKLFVTKDPYVFLLITAVFQAGALIKFYYRYSSNYPYSILLFFLSCSFTSMMNGLRQMFATCLIMYFVDFLFTKKYLRFAIIVFFAMTIHVSAIIWFPLIFIVQGKPANKKTLIFSFLVILALILTDSFTSWLADAIADTSYAGYTNQFQEDDGSSFFHTIIASIPLIISFVKRESIVKSQDKNLYILINISIIETLISLLANFTSGILIGRLQEFFSIFSYALLPRLFDLCFDEKDRRTMYTLCTIGFFAYFTYYLIRQNFGYNSIPLHLYL